jgi:hypothetical protein
VDARSPIAGTADPPSGTSPARGWVLGLAAWSLLVWGTRIDNILSDPALDGAGQAWRVALALSFVVPALTAGVRWRRRSGPESRPWAAAFLAWWTILVWIVRAGGIAAGDHDAAFITVHLVLAAVSIALAVVVLRLLPAPRSLLRR